MVCKKPDISIKISDTPVLISTKPIPVRKKSRQGSVKVNRQQEHPVSPLLPEFQNKLSSLCSHKTFEDVEKFVAFFLY